MYGCVHVQCVQMYHKHNMERSERTRLYMHTRETAEQQHNTETHKP